MWILHKDFRQWVNSCWAQIRPSSSSQSTKLKTLTPCYSHGTIMLLVISLKKFTLRNRIAGIQRRHSYPFSNFLHNFEKSLLVQYGLKFHQEEIFWAQRSCLGWLHQGDCNTKFFHTAAKIRQGSNTIHTLKDEFGILCLAEEEK